MMSLPLRLGLIYLCSELFLAATRRARAQPGTDNDRGTLRILWLVILSSVIAGLVVAIKCPFAALPNEYKWSVVAIVFFAGGLVLRWWAIITLGRFFTVDVTIAPDQVVVEKGPFRLMRHPSYTGVLLAFFGFALSLQNWLSLFVIVLPIFLALLRRMTVEEDALRNALGEAYAGYMRRTKRLLPFIY